MPTAIKPAIAGKSIKGTPNRKELLKLAVAAHDSTKRPASQEALATLGTAAETTDQTKGQVAAFARGRGGGFRGNFQRMRSHWPELQQTVLWTEWPKWTKCWWTEWTRRVQRPKPRSVKNTGPRHPDSPPKTACRLHKKWGNGAHFCGDKQSCPWKDRLTQGPTS